MTVGPEDRQPLNEREIAWLAIEITAALAVWIVATNLLLDSQLHAPTWLVDVVGYGGGFCVALGIGWWRMIRHGPLGPRRAQRGRLMHWGSTMAGDAKGAGLLVSGLGGLAMCIALLVEANGDRVAQVWGAVFGALAITQLTRFLHHRRS